MAKLFRKIVHYTPIRTFLIYFIIASFLIIAFKFPFDELFKSEALVVQQPAEVKPAPYPEICDGFDNDQNGINDDGLVKTQKCGYALCESTQTVTCINGKWATGECPGMRWATAEICDGVDNDCDGFVDNGLVAPRCDYYLGVCSGAYKTCGGGKGWLHCLDAVYEKAHGYQQVETDCIDGLDNDCDGYTDMDDTTLCHVHTNQ